MHCKLISVSFHFLIRWIGRAIGWMGAHGKWAKVARPPPAKLESKSCKPEREERALKSALSQPARRHSFSLDSSFTLFWRRICGKVLTFASEPRNNAEKHEVIIIRSARHRKQRNRPLVTLLSVSESLSSSSLSVGAYTTY